MSKVTTTVKTSALDSLAAGQRRGVESAARAILALEPTDRAIVAAIKGVMTVKGYGFSGRGVAAILADASVGRTSPATVARLILAGDEIADASQWPDALGDAAGAVAADLYRIACAGKSADVKRAGDAGRKSTRSDDAAHAVHAVMVEVMAARRAAAITPPARPVGGTADVSERSSKSPAPVKSAAPAPAADAITAASLSRLLAEVEARLAVKSATVAADDADAVDRIAARVMDLIEAGRTAGTRKTAAAK